MKIYSWNTLRSNAPERAFAFIRSLDFDVLCLQEVSVPLLEKLKTLPHSIVFEIETSFREHGVLQHDYSVVLSRYPLSSSTRFAFEPPPYPLKKRLFNILMHPAGWKQPVERYSMYADANTPEGVVRVFCMHLTLSFPAARYREFALAVSHMLPARPNVFAGDFNILDSLHITPLNWLFGGTLSETFAFRQERRVFEKRFEELGLQNPLRGTRTEIPAFCQLDHILIPRSWRPTKSRAIHKRHGSDHTPIFVDATASE